MRTESFSLSLERGASLSPDTYAHDVSEGRPVDDRMQLTDAAAWSAAARAEAVKLYEHPIALPSHAATLTLLWHPVS